MTTGVLGAILWLLNTVIDLIIIVLIVNAVLSWLIAFQLVGRYNSMVGQFYEATNRLVRPLLAPIRAVVPPVGGLDLSPMVLILGMLFLQRLLHAVAF